MIPYSKRKIYEKIAQENGYPVFQLTERQTQGKMIGAGKREEYFPVYFIEPYKGNEVSLGFDLGSNHVRLEALNKARNSGEMIATARITLVQEKEEQYGFLVFMPIYEKNVPLNTIEDRRQNLIGFVLGVFRIEEIIERALSYLGPDSIDIYLYDESGTPEERFLYMHLSRLRKDGSKLSDRTKGQENVLSITQSFNVANREWLLRAEPIHEYFEPVEDWHDWKASVGILFITFLSAFYLKNHIGKTIYIERLNIELLQKTKELEHVLYITSHDLRSPLVNIDGYSKEIGYSLKEVFSILQSDNDLENMREKISSIVKNDIPQSEHYISASISKMDSLLSGILQLSHSGRFEPKKEQLDMNRLMNDIRDSFEFNIKKAGAKLEISELPPCTGDADQINQVFSNLLGNALKYLDPERPGIIRVSGYKKNVQSVYCIEDNGIGIAPEYQEKIFEMFHQLKLAEGEGLGLTIVQRIIERHNGTIKVESESGKGSRFIVVLPG